MSKLKNNPVSVLFDRAAAIPYIMVTIVCMLLFPFGMCEKVNLDLNSAVYAAVITAIIWAVIVYVSDIAVSMPKKLLCFIGLTAVSTAAVFRIYSSGFYVPLMLWLPIAFIACAVCFLKKKDALTTRNFIAMMILAGIILRFVYVLYTASDVRQHDLGRWNGYKQGHATYILYWYENGLKLPDFDIRELWQFYHPPLHHWIMALMLKALVSAGIDLPTACEALQFLPMLYSCLIMVVCCKIFRRVNLGGAPLAAAMALICFHPTFVLVGGFYNNDMLNILLMLLAIDRTIIWYRQPTMRNIIPIAFFVGLAMMAKMSGWLVAPAIAFIFLNILKKNGWNFKKYIGQFLVFGGISFPLGLWWPVRNFISHGVPIAYVPGIGTEEQYVGNLSIFKRLFDFGNGQLPYTYDAFIIDGAPYDEYNPTVGLLKTSLFSESNYNLLQKDNTALLCIGSMLLWVGLIMFTVMFISLIAALISKKTNMEGTLKIFFTILAGVFLLSYYSFCITYPSTCTQNIRYCVPLIPLCAMGLGHTLQNHNNRVFRCAVFVLIGVFAVLTLLMFTMIGMIELR